MTSEKIRETMALWERQPDKAKGKPMVKARSEGSRAVIEAGSFTWQADLPPALGGSNEAPSPTAQLLGSLAACAVVLVRDTLAPQLGTRVDAVEATVQCETDSRGLLAMDGAAPDLTNIQLKMQIRSPDGEAAARKLFEAWQQRCPIYLALTRAMSVSAALEHPQT